MLDVGYDAGYSPDVRTAISIPDPIYKRAEKVARRAPSRRKSGRWFSRKCGGHLYACLRRPNPATVGRAFLTERFGTVPQAILREVEQGLRLVLSLG